MQAKYFIQSKTSQCDVGSTCSNRVAVTVTSSSLGVFFFNPKVLIFLLISPQKHMVWYSLEAPHRGASNEYQQHMFSWRNKKNINLIPTLIY